MVSLQTVAGALERVSVSAYDFASLSNGALRLSYGTAHMSRVVQFWNEAGMERWMAMGSPEVWTPGLIAASSLFLTHRSL